MVYQNWSTGEDSSRVAVFNEVENDIDIVKTKGRLKNLLENRQRKSDARWMWYWSYPLGNTWRTFLRRTHPHCSDDKDGCYGS